MRNLTEHTPHFAGSPRRASQAARSPRRLFRLDGGYVVLDPSATHGGASALASRAAQWGKYHVTAVIAVANDVSEWTIAELARAAQAFDRVVVCEAEAQVADASSEAAARLARAVRRAGRTECQFVSDPQRALRHCIDALVPGEVIVYCCDDVVSAARILADYGATLVRDAPPVAPGTGTGTSSALNGTTGAPAAVHA
jgi:SAM-dependent methyltransferase